MSRHAARADAEEGARSDHVLAAVLAAVVAAAVAVAAGHGQVGLVAALAPVQALLVVAWVVGTAVPGRIGGLLIGAGTAAGADAVLLARDRASLGALLGVLGLAFPVLLIHQLSRGVVRVRVTESMSSVAALLVVVAAAAAYLALIRAADGARLAAAAVVAVGAGLLGRHLVDAVLPVPRLAEDVPHGLLGVAVATGLGALVGAGYGYRAHQFEMTGGALLGAVVAAVAALVGVGVGYVASTAEPARSRPIGVAMVYLRVGVPLALAGPVAYLLGLTVVS